MPWYLLYQVLPFFRGFFLWPYLPLLAFCPLAPCIPLPLCLACCLWAELRRGLSPTRPERALD